MTGSFIHHLSDVQSTDIGEGTKIWQFCIVLPNAKIGTNCNICSNVFIENDVVLGNNVTIKSGVQLWDGLRVSDDVFIGPNVTFTNDPFPRSKRYLNVHYNTFIGAKASVGANCTILPGISIGDGAMIGAGTVVAKDVPANAIVVGNPGVITGYVGLDGLKNTPIQVLSIPDGINIQDTGVKGATLYSLPQFQDMRGKLSVAEYDNHIPFKPRRCFWVYDVPSAEVRGEHAHKELSQYLICVRGSVNIVLDDGISRAELVLNKPNLGLHISPLIWGIQYKFSLDAVLLVLASDEYKSSDYLRNYDEFLAYVADNKGYK